LETRNFKSLWPPVVAASHRNPNPLNNENFVVCAGETEKSFSFFFLKAVGPLVIRKITRQPANAACT
jgi:hypothetical protein